MAYQIDYPNKDRFESYAVLGDDVVIYGDRRVADNYLALMRSLGVTINISKSVISTNGTFEFAKRIGSAGLNLSPLGPKAMLLGIKYPKLFSITLIDSITKIGYDINEARERLAKLADANYFSPRLQKSYEVGLYGPGGVTIQKVDLMTYVNRPRPFRGVTTQVMAMRITEALLFYYERELRRLQDVA